MSKYVDQAVNAVIRPPRKQYDPNTLPLFIEGPGGMTYVRHPVNITNQRRQPIRGSLYLDATHDLMDGGPCVVYMHGNASSQHEGQFLIPNLCPHGVAVYCFDFAGCGASGGDFISLGHFESIDVTFLVETLESSFGLKPFVLWGRSMGAATALLVNHPFVVGRIADSAYKSIPDVCQAIATKLGMPSIFVPAALLFLKLTVLGRADFDLSEVSPFNSVQQPGQVPVLICHAADDEFIPSRQGEELFMAYSNPDRRFVSVVGGHNGRRSLDWIGEACLFAMKHLGVTPPPDFKPVRFVGMHDADQHFRSYNDLLRFMNTKGGQDSDVDSPVNAQAPDDEPPPPE